MIFDTIKPKPNSDIHNRNGIYKTKWSECKFYLGQMVKKTKTDSLTPHSFFSSISTNMI